MSYTVAPNSLPVFDGSNYTLWKIRMRAYLKFVDVWHIVESGWSIPDKTMAEWTTVENRASSANDKALHSIFTAVSMEEFSRISRCVIAKEAWETIEITHEGTEVVRASKLQMLVSKFEEIRMQEDVTFDEFYSKLSSIRNNTINLGKKMSDAKIIKKILRSLPPRFLPQIAAINQRNDLNTMRVEELVGSIQTFELLLPQPKNSKNIALKTKTAGKEKSGGSTDDDSGDEEEIAMIVRKFRKFFKPKNGNFKGRNSRNPENSRHDGRDNLQDRNTVDQKDKFPSGPKCYECGGIGHIRANCGNLRNSKGRAFNVTQSDESNNEEKAENVANYVAFGVSYESEHEASECNSLDSDYGICDNESEEEGDLQNAYNALFLEYNNLKKLNKQTLQKLKEVNLEKDKLSSTLNDSHAIHDILKYENDSLIAKVKSLESDLNDSRNHLNTFSNEKLNHMLHNQKHSFDRTGLGFDKSVVSSTNVVSPSKLIFVKPACKEENLAKKKEMLHPVSRGKKGKGILTDSYVSRSTPRRAHMPRNQPTQRFIPMCHHCGKIGHIRPKCFQLNNHESKRGYFRSINSYDKLFNMVRGVITQLNDLDKSRTSVPKMKKVWVKKDATIHPLRGSGGDITLC
jgi:hypothetical protein